MQISFAQLDRRVEEKWILELLFHSRGSSLKHPSMQETLKYLHCSNCFSYLGMEMSVTPLFRQ